MPSFDQQVSRERAAGAGAARARNAIAGACANEPSGFITTHSLQPHKLRVLWGGKGGREARGCRYYHTVVFFRRTLRRC